MKSLVQSLLLLVVSVSCIAVLAGFRTPPRRQAKFVPEYFIVKAKEKHCSMVQAVLEFFCIVVWTKRRVIWLRTLTRDVSAVEL